MQPSSEGAKSNLCTNSQFKRPISSTSNTNTNSHVQSSITDFLPWIVGDKLPRLVVHVGKAVVEVGAEVSVDIVDVKSS